MTKNQKWIILSIMTAGLLFAIFRNKSVEVIVPEDKSYISDGAEEKYKKLMNTPCYGDDGVEVECKG